MGRREAQRGACMHYLPNVTKLEREAFEAVREMRDAGASVEECTELMATALQLRRTRIELEELGIELEELDAKLRERGAK